MKLRDYFIETGIRRNFFCEKIGCTPQQLYSWVSGRCLPPLNFVYLIEKFTNGKVKYTDFIAEELVLKSKSEQVK